MSKRTYNHRHDAKRDTNETPIFNALKSAGISVEKLNGKGIPDLLTANPYYPHICPSCGIVYGQPENVLIEVKVPGEGLTDPQKIFHRDWKGPPIPIAYSIEDALRQAGMGRGA